MTVDSTLLDDLRRRRERIEVGGGEAPLYPGGYEDFLYWKRKRELGEDAPMPVGPLAARRQEASETAEA